MARSRDVCQDRGSCLHSVPLTKRLVGIRETYSAKGPQHKVIVVRGHVERQRQSPQRTEWGSSGWLKSGV